MSDNLSKKSGFTLIELLAAVGIIAILAALGLAGLGKARVAADAAVCKGNLRQIGIALHLYLSDEGQFPLQTEQGDPDVMHHWPEYLEAYAGAKWPSDGEFKDGVLVGFDAPTEIERPNLYVCPGYRRVRGWFVGPSPQSAGFGFLGAYGYNATGMGGTGLGGAEVGQRWPKGRHAPVKEAMVVSPSQMYAFGDASLWYADLDQATAWGNAFDLGFRTSYAWNGDKGQRHTFPLVRRRHAGTFVVLSVDGHTEKIAQQEFLYPYDLERLRRFSRDNLPHEENRKIISGR